MTAGKMKNGNQADPFPSMLNGINLNGSKGGSNMREIIPNEDHDADQKEVIRRLKIQNAKLLQQVGSLRKKVKQQRTGKKIMTDETGKLPNLEIRIKF